MSDKVNTKVDTSSVFSGLVLVALLVTSALNYHTNSHQKNSLDGRGAWIVDIQKYIEEASKDRLTRESFLAWEQEFRTLNGLNEASKIKERSQPVFPTLPDELEPEVTKE